MMFTEKILQRKTAGIDPQSKKEEVSDVSQAQATAESQGRISRILNFGETLKSTIKNKFSWSWSGKKPQEVAPPASLGKILNIMR